MKERQIDVYLNLIFHQHGTSHVQTITGQMKYSVTMKQYFDKIILPYVNEKRKELKLSSDHPALLIFDNFKAQKTSSILKFMDGHNLDIVLLPANCNDRLQPLDLLVNKFFTLTVSGLICQNIAQTITRTIYMY